MPQEAFDVDYIMRAERVKRKGGDVIWAYMVKWKFHGYFNFSREDRTHSCFKKNPSILQEFWNSMSFTPDEYDHIGAVVVPPQTYIDQCKEKYKTVPTSPKAPNPPAKRKQYAAEASPLPSTGKKRIRQRAIIDDSDDDSFIDNWSTEVSGIADDSESLFGDSIYDNVTSNGALSSVANPSPIPAHRLRKLNPLVKMLHNSPVSTAIGSQSTQAKTIPGVSSRRMGVLGPSRTSVAVFDKKSSRLITTRRNESSFDPQNIPPPSDLTLTDPVAPPEELMALGGYNAYDAETLPDFEDDVLMTENEPTRIHLNTEQYGPPELGIEDDDLYVPHDATDNQPATPHVQRPTTDEDVVMANVSDSSPPHPETTANYAESVTGRNNVVSSQLQSVSHITVPSNSLQLVQHGVPTSGLILSVAQMEDLPLLLKDVRSEIFKAIFSTTPRLPSDGFYQHADVQSVIGTWHYEGCDITAKLILGGNPVAEQHKEIWRKLDEDLFRKKYCLIALFSNIPDALIIFSSRSKSFGNAIGASSRLLGFAKTVVACLMKNVPRPVPLVSVKQK
ncbi:hypothetical protein K439DRAFT_1628529 [Ramaria rubella]|nr:hypothetical protein K439DRAFT_1628529 [Ramaria rubella]